MNQSGTTRFFIVAASLVIVVAGMRAAQPVLVPLLLSLFLAFVAATPLFWLQRKDAPKWLALLALVTGVLVLGLLVAALIGHSLNDFSSAPPTYQARLEEKQAALLRWLGGIGIHISI